MWRGLDSPRHVFYWLTRQIRFDYFDFAKLMFPDTPVDVKQ
jgi:hypothetical protein